MSAQFPAADLEPGSEHLPGDATGRVWSEDPTGRFLNLIVVDFETPLSGRSQLSPDGALKPSPHCDIRTLEALRRIVIEAERQLRSPAVVRWRGSGDNLEILETRAITDPLPWSSALGSDIDPEPHPSDRWSRANVGEIIPNVMTPFSWSAAAGLLEEGYRSFWGDWAAGRRFVAMYDGYVYFNFGLIMELVEDRFGLSADQLLQAVGGPEASEWIDAGGPGQSTTTINWTTLVRRLPFLIGWLRDQHRLPQRWPEMRAATEAERDRLRALELDGLSDREITAHVSHSYAETKRQATFAMLAQTAAFTAAQGLFWALDRWLGAEHRSLSLQLLQGVPGIRTQDGNLALRRIAWRVAQDEAARAFVEGQQPVSLWPALHSDRLPPDLAWLRDDLDRFLEEYGHRCAGELEVAEPRWVDRPELILSSFYDYIHAPGPHDLEQSLARQRAARETAEAQIQELLRATRFGGLRWRLLRAQVHQARRLQPLRENPKFTLLELALQQLRLWRALAARWLERGLLDEPDDLFFLQIGELEALAESPDDPLVAGRMTSRIRRRRLQYADWVRSDAPPLRDRDGRAVATMARRADESQEAAQAEPERGPPSQELPVLPLTLRGIAASSGTVEGPAHVADSVSAGRRLTTGAILVARFTDPGWTPILSSATAVVTEIGGVLSHGAIVAREQGIPAVVNVQRITRLVRSGDLLRVDGARGEVTILSRPDAES